MVPINSAPASTWTGSSHGIFCRFADTIDTEFYFFAEYGPQRIGQRRRGLFQARGVVFAYKPLR